MNKLIILFLLVMSFYSINAYSRISTKIPLRKEITKGEIRKAPSLPDYAIFSDGILELPETFAEYTNLVLNCIQADGSTYSFTSQGRSFDISVLETGCYMLELCVGENKWIGMVELD